MKPEQIALAQKVAKEWRELHKNHKTSRPFSEDYEFIGILGIIKFGEVFDLEPDFTLKPGGDDGIDFILPSSGYTVDVKTAAKPIFLFVEEGKVRADIYVLAGWDGKDITLYGWMWDGYVRHAPVKDWGSGVLNHYIRREKLLLMDRLLELK